MKGEQREKKGQKGPWANPESLIQINMVDRVRDGTVRRHRKHRYGWEKWETRMEYMGDVNVRDMGDREGPFEFPVEIPA